MDKGVSQNLAINAKQIMRKKITKNPDKSFVVLFSFEKILRKIWKEIAIPQVNGSNISPFTLSICASAPKEKNCLKEIKLKTA